MIVLLRAFQISSHPQALAKATVEEDWNKLPTEAQEMYVKMAEGNVAHFLLLQVFEFVNEL